MDFGSRNSLCIFAIHISHNVILALMRGFILVSICFHRRCPRLAEFFEVCVLLLLLLIAVGCGCALAQLG